jgi:ElaB/YqjD/DUF883 family membrane-anchored ribosome-binding protein
MAERVRTPDIPDFDTYPAPSGRPILEPERELEEGGGIRRLAESVGEKLGVAFSGLRVAPRRMRELKRRFTLIRGRARMNAETATVDMRREAERRLEIARERARYIAREYPLQVIAVAAVVGVAIGAGLRLWRSNRD